MDCEQEGVWESVVVDNDYEIFNQYPYPIRRKETDRVTKEHIDSLGYVGVNLNGKRIKKHRIIAIQWLENPNNHPQIDHINHIKTDNRLENLRWCSASSNMRNRGSVIGHVYEFYDSISDESIAIEHYNNYLFDGYYYDPIEDEVFFLNPDTNKYRKIIRKIVGTQTSIRLVDIDGVRRELSLKKLKIILGF